MNNHNIVEIYEEGLKNADTNVIHAFTKSITDNLEEDKIENTLKNTYALGYQKARVNTYAEYDRMNAYVESLDSFKLITDVNEIAQINEIYTTNSNNLALKSFLVQRLVALCAYLKDAENKFNKEYKRKEDK